VRVVHVPEKGALLQVIGDDDEQVAAGPEHAARFRDELTRRIDPRHVLEHLIRVDDVGAQIVRPHRRRVAFDNVESLLAKVIDEDRARFHGAVTPARRHRAFGERALAGADLEHVAGSLRVAHQQTET
jgi:hypothetical protein